MRKMRIACPACAAAYDVPDRLLAGPPRTLRCSRCGTDFALPRAEAPAEVPSAEPPPAAPAPAVPPPAEPPPAAPPDPPAVTEREPPPPPRPRPVPLAAPRRPMDEPVEVPPPRGLAGAWVASIALVMAAIFALLVFRAKVIEVWPASGRLFAALGLT